MIRNITKIISVRNQITACRTRGNLGDRFMNFGFYCLNGFLLGKTGSNISPDGTDITTDLLVNIIGAVGSWNLGDLQWLTSLNASLVKVIRNLHNIFHITVKEIFLKYFRIIFHRNYIVNRVKIIHKSLSQNALISFTTPISMLVFA